MLQRWGLLVASLAAVAWSVPSAPSIGGNPIGVPVSDAGALTGTWYLDRKDVRLRAELRYDPERGAFSGSLSPEAGGAAEAVERLTWDASTGALAFRSEAGWIRGRIVDGVLVGRFAAGADGDEPPAATAFADHVTGWNEEAIDVALVPRVYELLLDGQRRARLRVDGDGAALTGRLKIYADAATGCAAEEDEYDLDALAWDGTTLRFATHGGDRERVYEATATGRFLTGTYTGGGASGSGSFTGARAEILSYGLLARAPADQAAWQARTRRQIRHLAMAGDPPALSRTVTVLGVVGPRPSVMLAPDRDDDPAAHPQRYRVSEMFLDHTLADPEGGAPLVRRSHVRLFLPDAAPPPSGFPAVLALNGHGGSAYRMTDPDDLDYWFGDGFARRGWVVLALDVSHRPLEDRRGLYDDFLMGDSPEGGNVVHPAIKSPGLDSDWAEDGERAWDALRALDFLRALPQVDATRLAVSGLSMGGEITSFVGALDEGVAVTIPSAPPTDLGVMRYHGNHPCWEWLDADIREYLDMSDLHALNAPRALVIETGKQDGTYSARAAPWAGAKQVARRTRAAYAGVEGRFLHYLHYDDHHYHVGSVDPTKAIEVGVRLPVLEAPASPFSLDWQTDGATTGTADLFEVIARFLR